MSLVSAMGPVLYCCCVAAVNPTDEYKSVCYLYLNTQDQSDLSDVPAILWAKHKNQVECVISALLHNVILKVNG